MRLHFASIPVLGDASAESELNQFLAAHRVVSVERHLVDAGTASVWAVCVTYLDGEAGSAFASGKKGATRVDYREVLDDAQFAVFAQLRSLRKSMAEQEGVPPYALFTNEHLAAMVQRKVTTLQELGQIEGVGKARMEKYGEAFLNLLESYAPSGQPAPPAASEPAPHQGARHRDAPPAGSPGSRGGPPRRGGT